MRYVEGPEAPCDRCGEVSIDGHEDGSGRLCCGCFHSAARRSPRGD